MVAMANPALILTSAPPRTHLRILPMTDDTERRDNPTIEAPPLSETEPERKTNPEASAPPAIQSLRPPPPDPYDTSFLQQDDSTFSRAVILIANAARALDEDRERQRFSEQQAQENHRALLTAITRADDNGNRNYEMLRSDIRHLKDSDREQDRRLAEGEERFGEIERSIEILKGEFLAALPGAIRAILAPYLDRIDVLEREIEDLKKNVSARSPSPTEAAQQT